MLRGKDFLLSVTATSGSPGTAKFKTWIEVAKARENDVTYT